METKKQHAPASRGGAKKRDAGIERRNAQSGGRQGRGSHSQSGRTRPESRDQKKLSAPINSQYDSLGFKKRDQSKARPPMLTQKEKKNPNGGEESRREKQGGKRKNRSANLKVIPIGGLNEIGKNMTVLEYQDQMMIIDCGMSFPDNEMYGIDVVIPDFSYVIENADKVRGVVITHGHEDHIGGVPYLLRKIQVPIYGTALSIGLIRNKLEEHGLQGDLRLIHAGDTIRLGDYFKVRILRTTHSIADSICLCIDTPAARVFHTGDFKIDYTPVDGEPIHFGELAEIGDSGVDLLLADSTNATRKGFTPSEKTVGETLDRIFRDVKKRIIIATFSSNVHRVQSIIDLSIKYGRKFAVSGRSMENVMSLATELGYLKFPQSSYVELSKTRGIPDNELTIITTGSQGEPMSALARMAAGEHRNIKLKKGDTVILSSSPVPGNEKSVSNVVNQLFQREVNVIYNDVADIHVSGHACQEDLKLMHALIRPKFFMPVHGEHRHLVMHQRLAESLGMKDDHIFILDNGDQLSIDKNRAIKFRNVVPAEDIMVDGLGVGDIGNAVLKDRRLLSESGIIIAVAALDKDNCRIVSGPEIITRGFVYVKDHEELIEGARKNVEKSIEKHLSGGFKDWKTLKSAVQDDLKKYIFMRTRKSPMIFPVFLSV